MDKNEMSRRYRQWLETGTKLPYLEDWEQWRAISHDDPELYAAIQEQRIALGLEGKSHVMGLDL